MEKRFIGVDLHKKLIVFCVVNQSRKVLERRRFSNDETAAMTSWLETLRPFDIVVEATAGYEWFAKMMEPLASRFVLAHPGKLRVIAESTRKSDKVDAQVLAEFLSNDMIPAACRPSPRVREHRRLTRYRHHVQGRITSLKNRIRHVLADYNADQPNLFTRKGREYVESLTLSDADRFVLDELIASLDHHDERLSRAEKALREFAKKAPEQEKKERRLLETIPGVGPVTIDIFLAEAADVRRFRSQKRLTAYAGLAPGHRESAGRRKELGITRTGSSLLRWVMVQAAWQLVRYDERWLRLFESLAKRRGKKKAIVAMARRLLCMMMSVVTNERPYSSLAA